MKFDHMNRKKLVLNHLLEIGGVATLNNLFSPKAASSKGGLLGPRKLIKSFLSDGLVEKIQPIGKPSNKCHEVFYCLTKKGAHYVGRPGEYRYRKYQKSPHNVMHESMKFDFALALLRLYPSLKFSFRYDSSFFGVRPDILVCIEPFTPDTPSKYLLIEIERKKTVDRVYNEKISRYEEMFSELKNKEGVEEDHYMVLFVYTHIWFDVFLRPQEYQDETARFHIEQVNKMLLHLSSHYCSELPHHRYRFISFHDIFRLNEEVWLKPRGTPTFMLGS